jgi:hypothetical protein
MQQGGNLIRRYASQAAFEQDAVRLARLGYVVLHVSEQAQARGWVKQLIQRLVAPPRLIVTYSDQGIVPS